MTIVALDVDLRKIYAVSDAGQVLHKAEPSPDRVIVGLQDSLRHGDLVLIEVSSPVAYVKSPGAMHNMLRWGLWNISVATMISNAMGPDGPAVLVAPSHVWTKGHALKVRHDVAGCKAKQKDLRECEAMIYYYTASPESWVALPEYLENL